MRIRAVVTVALALLAACARTPEATSAQALIVVNAPLAKEATIARQIERGAILAVEEINASGGVVAGAARVRLKIRTVDSELSPERSAANVREAAGSGAVAFVDEGTGVDASWSIAAAAGLPIGIVHQGAEHLVDPARRPNVFRVAPTNRGVSFRLAEYLVPKGLRLAIIHDDSSYGSGGATSLAKAFSHNKSSVAATVRVPAAATDVHPEILRARQSGASALLVWSRPLALAQIVRAARSTGWNVPIYTATSGEDPLLRQQLSDHPEWIDGLTFAASRLTAERGPEPFEKFRTAYERRFGPDRIGVQSGEREVVQPPDWAMYPYDFVRIVAAAMTRAGTASPGAALITAMNEVDVTGANGDERGFNERNHEGVVDDDVFFATFRDMVWVPVRDDALSGTLPEIAQTI